MDSDKGMTLGCFIPLALLLGLLWATMMGVAPLTSRRLGLFAVAAVTVVFAAHIAVHLLFRLLFRLLRPRPPVSPGRPGGPGR